MSITDIFVPKSEKEILFAIKDSIKNKIIPLHEFIKLTKDYSRDERRIIKKLKSGKFNYVLPNFWLDDTNIAEIINPLLYRKIKENKQPHQIKLRDLELLNFGQIALVRKLVWERDTWQSYYDRNSRLRITSIFWLLKTNNIWVDGIQQ